jgi:hypothetical protein
MKLPLEWKTKMVYDTKNVENLGIHFIKKVKERIDILTDRDGLSIIMKSNTYKNNYIHLRNKGATIMFLQRSQMTISNTARN